MQGYTPSEAAKEAVRRVEKISQISHDYGARHDDYIKKFSHLRKSFGYIVCENYKKGGDNRIKNSAVEGMIRMWLAAGDRRIKLAERDAQELTDNPGKFALQVKRHCDVLYAIDKLESTQQTIGSYMNKGWLKYHRFGNERKPEKALVDRIRKYALVKGKIDHNRILGYFKKITIRNALKAQKKGLGYDALESRCNILIDQVSELKEENSRLKKTSKEGKKGAAKQKATKERLEKQISQVRKKRDEYYKEKSKLGRQNESLQRQYDRLQTEYQNNLGIIAEHEKSANRKPEYGDPTESKEYKILLKQNETLESQIKTISDRSTAADNGIITLKNQIAELQELYENKESEKAAISKQLAAANGQVSSLTAKNQKLIQQKDEAIRQNRGYKAQIAVYERASKPRKKDDPKKTADYRLPLEQKKGSDAQVRALTRSLDNTNKRIMDLETEVKELQETARYAAEEKSTLMAKIAGYEAKLTQKESKAKKTEETALSEKERKQLTEKIEELTQANANLEARIKSLSQQLQDAKQRTEEGIRIYIPSETYEAGERIYHTIWESDGTVISASGGNIDALFDDPNVGRRTLSQGKKIRP